MKNRVQIVFLFFLLSRITLASSQSVQIGFTTYDWQSNASVGHRLINYGNGKLSAVWKFSPDFDPGDPGLGTAYNSFDGTSWLSVPGTRLEVQRTDCPSIYPMKNGKELILSHKDSPFNFLAGKNSAIGSASYIWNNSNATLQLGPVNQFGMNGKIACSGSDTNTVHLISIYSDTSIVLNGVHAPVVYSQSSDGGQTWSVQSSSLAGYDGTRTKSGKADAYDIDAAGQNVAIVIGGPGEDVAFWKSVNNGGSFTKTIIDSFPYAPDMLTTGSIGDSAISNDGAVSVTIDKNGMAHVVYSLSKVYLALNGASQPEQYFIPDSIGLIYWDEISHTKIRIPLSFSQFDGDGDGNYSYGSATNDPNFAAYGSMSLLTQPGIAMDTSGNIFVIFSMPQDAVTTIDDQSYRDIWVIRSTDNGLHWSCPGNITKTIGIEESFPSVAKLVDDNIHILYQQDGEPGTRVFNNDAYDQNLIYYMKVDKDLPGIFTPEITGDTLICAGDSVLLSCTQSGGYAWSTSENTQNIYAHSPGWYSVSTSSACCNGTDSIHVSAEPLPVAAIMIIGDTTFCYGSGSVTLMGNISNAYHWSNGSTNSSVTFSGVNQSGIYRLITFNICGDSTVSSPVNIAIYPLPSPPVITQNGTSFTCQQTGMNYQWYIGGMAVTGATSQTYTPANDSLTPGKQVKVQITDTHGCSAMSTELTHAESISQKNSALIFYPNPADNELFLEYSGSDFSEIKIEISDMTGRIVYIAPAVLSHIFRIDIGWLDTGIYLLNIHSGKNSETKKLVVF